MTHGRDDSKRNGGFGNRPNVGGGKSDGGDLGDEGVAGHGHDVEVISVLGHPGLGHLGIYRVMSDSWIQAHLAAIADNRDALHLELLLAVPDHLPQVPPAPASSKTTLSPVEVRQRVTETYLMMKGSPPEKFIFFIPAFASIARPTLASWLKLSNF